MIHALRVDGTTTQDLKKQKQDRAEFLIKRWAILTRLGLPDLGYPHQSPEQERVRGLDVRNVEMDKLDEKVMCVMKNFSPKPRRIAKEYWLYGKSMQEIAWAEKLSKSGVKWRLDSVKDKVVRECGL